MTFKRTFAVSLFAIALVTAAYAEEFREEFHQTYSIQPSGTVSLDNVNGDVQIQTWDRNEVQVDAVKTAESQQQLEEVEIRVNASSDRIDIETYYPRKKYNNNRVEVEYTLMVPDTINLDQVELVNGDLTIRGVRGSVSVSSVNGRIDITGVESSANVSTVNGSLDLSVEHLTESLELESVNGSVTLSLPENASANFNVDTLNGGIQNDFGLFVQKERYVGRNLNGKLKEGDHQIDISTVNGSIRIKK